MAWTLGTDATDKLKATLVTWIEGRFAVTAIKARLPKRSIKVVAPKGTQRISGSIKVLLYTGADDALPHEYKNAAGALLMEEFHRVTIDVQSDEKGAKVDEMAKVAGIIRQQLIVGRDALTALGVYDVQETTEELEIDGVDFSRPINLTCNTDVILAEAVSV